MALSELRLTIKADMSQVDNVASVIGRMADFMRDNPEHDLSRRMAVHGEIANGKDFHIDTDTRRDPLTVSASVTWLGPFADIVRDFEAMECQNT